MRLDIIINYTTNVVTVGFDPSCADSLSFRLFPFYFLVDGSQNLRNNESRVIVCSSARISETTTKRSEDGESQVVFAIICSTTLCTCVASLYKHINPSLGDFLLTERRRQRRGKLAATALVQNDKRVKDSIVGCCTRQIEEETDGPFISPSLVSWAAVAAILFLFFFHFHFRNSFVIWKLLFQRQPLMLIRE